MEKFISKKEKFLNHMEEMKEEHTQRKEILMLESMRKWQEDMDEKIWKMKIRMNQNFDSNLTLPKERFNEIWGVVQQILSAR